MVYIKPIRWSYSLGKLLLLCGSFPFLLSCLYLQLNYQKQSKQQLGSASSCMNQDSVDQRTVFQESLEQFLVDCPDAPNPLLMHRIMAALRGELPHIKSQIAFAQITKYIHTQHDDQHWLKVLRELIIIDKLIEEMMFLQEVAAMDLPQIDQLQSNKEIKETVWTKKLLNSFWKLLKTKSAMHCNQDHIFNYRRSQRSTYLRSLSDSQILSQVRTIQTHFLNIRLFVQCLEGNNLKQLKRWSTCGCYQYLSLQLLYKFMCAYSCQLQCQQALLSHIQEMSLDKVAQFRRVITRFRQNCQSFIVFINGHNHIKGFQEINAEQIKNTINSQLAVVLQQYSTYREMEGSFTPLSPLPCYGQSLQVETKPLSDLSVHHIAPRLVLNNKTHDKLIASNVFSEWRSSFSCEFPQREIMTIDLIFQLRLQQTEQKSDKFYRKQQEGCYEREDISYCSYDNRSTNVTSTYQFNLKNYTLKKFDLLPRKKLNFQDIYSRLDQRWHGGRVVK